MHSRPTSLLTLNSGCMDCRPQLLWIKPSLPEGQLNSLSHLSDALILAIRLHRQQPLRVPPHHLSFCSHSSTGDETCCRLSSASSPKPPLSITSSRGVRGCNSHQGGHFEASGNILLSEIPKGHFLMLTAQESRVSLNTSPISSSLCSSTQASTGGFRGPAELTGRY